MTQILKSVPLESRHKDAGAKMVPFAGYNMPLQYDSISTEHLAVRHGVGLFDVSHMGEIEVRGEDALDVVDRIVTNDCHALVDGKALYTVMCHEDGGIVDDLLVYRLAQDHVFLCVNAANRDKDFAHITEYASGAAEITDTGDDWVQLALQGPQAMAMLAPLTSEDATELKYFRAAFMKVAGVRSLVSRTGYTGEDGVELYIPAAEGGVVFDALVAQGAAHDLQMCGLGARDTLRLEAKLHLYGQDMDDTIDPLTAGLGWVVKFDKSNDFVGKQALLERKEAGTEQKLVGLVVEDRGVIRSGYEVFVGDAQVGRVTSGIYSPLLEQSIGLAYIDRDHAMADEVEVAVRKRRLRATVTTRPFYKRS